MKCVNKHKDAKMKDRREEKKHQHQQYLYTIQSHVFPLFIYLFEVNSYQLHSTWNEQLRQIKMLPRTPSKGLRKLRLHLCHSLSSLLLFVIMILPSGSVGKSPKQILLGTKYSDTSSLNEDKRWEKASSASYIHNHVKHRTTPY